MSKVLVRSDIAMMATKLNAHWQVIIKNLEPEYAREIPPTGTHGGAEKDGTASGVSGLGPPATGSGRQGTTVPVARTRPRGRTRTFRPHHRLAVVVEPWDGHDPGPPADST